MDTPYIKFRILVIIIISSSLMLPQKTAYAWKPTTHVYLAEIALQDALDNGTVTIYATDYIAGRVLRDSVGNPVILGEYPVDAQVLEALRNYPEQFRAGVLGPDAYPDIATGQQVIHPAGTDTPGQPSGVDINKDGSGSDPWLTYLWHRAFNGCDSEDNDCTTEDMTPANQAFVLGFLAHAAGDMYGHTFINYYTGGPFHFEPMQENAIKHVVLEGYIDKRTPELVSYEASISDGVDSFIYRNMIKASPDSYLAECCLKGESAKNTSLPYIFSKLRAQLDREIKAYDEKLKWYDDQKDYAGKIIYMGANGPGAEYKRAWREDIDQGLQALPGTSHELAKALFFNPNGLDPARAQQIAEDYTQQHVLSMAGLPDFVGASLQLIDSVLEALGIPEIKQAIDQMKRDLLNYLLSKAFNITIEDIEKYLKNPETHFDPTLNDPALNLEGTGHLISLRSFNTEQLHINDTGYTNPEERYDYQNFPAAYNSVIMTKLLLMSRDGINQLLHDLNANTTSTLTADNIMLGFVETLDGSNQWIVNYDPKKMVIATDCIAYRKIFMQQVGEDVSEYELPCQDEPNTPTETSAPGDTSTEPTPTNSTSTEASPTDSTPLVTTTTPSPPTAELPSSDSNWPIPSGLMTIIMLMLLVILILLCSILIVMLLLAFRLFSDSQRLETSVWRRHIGRGSPQERDELTLHELSSALAAKEDTIIKLKETLATQEALIEQLRSNTEK